MGVDYFVCECCDDEPYNTCYCVVINIYPRNTTKDEDDEYSNEKIESLNICTACWKDLKENVIIMGEDDENGGDCIKLKENKRLSYYHKNKVVIDE